MKSNSHETIRPHAPTAGPSNRNFGFTVGGILAALGLFRWFISLHYGALTLAFLAIGAALLLLAAVAPALLTVPNRLWMKLGELLARIVNPIVMFLVFVAAFVPIGMFMRWRGHDPLHLKRKDSDHSYWIDRDVAEQTGRGMSKQY